MLNILKKKIVKAAGWYTITDFFLKGIMFITIPVFTRLLTTDDYGMVGIYDVWLNITSIIMLLGLRGSIGIAKTDFKDNYNKFVSSISFLSFISFCLFLIIILFFLDFFVKISNLSGFLIYFLLFHSFFLGIKDIYITKMRFEYYYKFISCISIFTVIFGLFLSIFLIKNIFIKNPYMGVIIGKGSLVILIGSILFIWILYKGKQLINVNYWNYSLYIGIPMIFHSLSHIINGQFDRILINRYIDSSAVGIYSFSYNIGLIIQVLVNAMNSAWTPWFYKNMAEGNYINIKNNTIKYRNVFIFLYTSILFISPEIIRIMADKSYWTGMKIIPWIFLACFFQHLYIYEVAVEFFFKKANLIAIGTILSALINIILNIIFIPIYGYSAAAITTVISYFFLFVFHYIITHYLLKKNVFDLKFHIRSILFISLITILFLIIEKIFFLRLICLIGFCAYFLYYLKSSLAKSD